MTEKEKLRQQRINSFYQNYGINLEEPLEIFDFTSYEIGEAVDIYKGFVRGVLDRIGVDSLQDRIVDFLINHAGETFDPAYSIIEKPKMGIHAMRGIVRYCAYMKDSVGKQLLQKKSK